MPALEEHVHIPVAQAFRPEVCSCCDAEHDILSRSQTQSDFTNYGNAPEMVFGEIGRLVMATWHDTPPRTELLARSNFRKPVTRPESGCRDTVRERKHLISFKGQRVDLTF